MNQTTLNLQSIACKSIKCFNFFQKPSIYAVITITSPSNPTPQSVKTAADSNGGEDPEFENQIFKFNLDGSNLTLEIDLMLQGNILTLSGDRLVGKVTVPVIDLLKGGGDGFVRHVSYQVIGNDGKANGVMTFSYEIKQKVVKLPAIHDNNVYPMPAKQDPYVPPYQQYQATMVHQPPSNQLYPTVELYPPPRPHQQYTVGGDVCPLPRQQYSFEQQPAANCCYPPPPRQELDNCYPRIHAERSYYVDPRMTGHVAQSSPSVPSACFYPTVDQQDGYGFRPETRDRRLW